METNDVASVQSCAPTGERNALFDLAWLWREVRSAESYPRLSKSHEFHPSGFRARCAIQRVIKITEPSYKKPRATKTGRVSGLVEVHIWKEAEGRQRRTRQPIHRPAGRAAEASACASSEH